MNESLSNLTTRHVLRITIQLTTPCLIASGKPDELTDTVFVTDANGLPTLPGSSLAGILRAAFRAQRDNSEDEERLFGSAEGNASHLKISCACIHNSKDRPIEGIIPPEELNDLILAAAKSPVVRDHVKLGDHGAADTEDGAKFDEKAIAAGHRFTFEIELSSNGDEHAQGTWKQIIDLIHDPSLRIGGKSRRGFGAFKIVKIKERSFDLTSPTDFADYCSHPVSLAAPAETLSQLIHTPSTNNDQLIYTLKLKPAGYWMIGGGDAIEEDESADIVPFRDQKIVWNDDQTGSILEDQIVIPGSSIKGALSHRIAFHYNAITGAFADCSDNPATTGEKNPAIRALFGHVDNNTENYSRRGTIIIDDLYLDRDPSSAKLHHVGIDRFTGGARDSVLFDERPFWKGDELTVRIFATDPSVFDDDAIREAFDLTLQDLTEGRLQIGAGSGRGLGFFTGKVERSPSN